MSPLCERIFYIEKPATHIRYCSLVVLYLFNNMLLLFCFAFCWFCRRFHIRGAQHVIFYSLPEYAHFYSEYVNMLSARSESKQGGKGQGRGGGSGGSDEDVKISCLVLYTAYERMALERIVGAKRCAHMLAASKSTFVYC